ncbi:hypothetical protein, partial [Xanthomonas citri]|uniref:hypothetical protein n=1 Tax=Xanthomonas citri TaxID=346 RepID=UPI00198053E0
MLAALDAQRRLPPLRFDGRDNALPQVANGLFDAFIAGVLRGFDVVDVVLQLQRQQRVCSALFALVNADLNLTHFSLDRR